MKAKEGRRSVANGGPFSSRSFSEWEGVPTAALRHAALDIVIAFTAVRVENNKSTSGKRGGA